MRILNSMPNTTFIKTLFIQTLYGLGVIIFCCGYFIYYFVQLQTFSGYARSNIQTIEKNHVLLSKCSWPTLTLPTTEPPVYAMILADTHLLGPYRGHWLDKLFREWEMYRAFQTAITIHRPEVIFFLGDIFDEGQSVTDKRFEEYINNFHSVFKVPEGIETYVVAGNHDIGFHYVVTPRRVERFDKAFDSRPVRLVSIRGNHFVLINSVAMQDDGCFLCATANYELNDISDILKCSSGSQRCKSKKRLSNYSRPIIMQHFPLYRPSDAMCTEPDAAPLSERFLKSKERWDCLSKESTESLVATLKPRAVFGGHTHHGCYIQHNVNSKNPYDVKFTEYSIPSFSWRNRRDPKYFLVTFTPEEFRVSKCAMPTEVGIITFACILVIMFVLYLRHIVFAPNRHRKPHYFKL